MTEIKLGDKYECFNCGAKFYDLGRGAPVCPKCGADQHEAEAADNPLMTQSVKRRRKAELLPDVADAGEEAATPLAAEELDEEDLELDEDEIEEAEVEAEAEVEVEEEVHEA